MRKKSHELVDGQEELKLRSGSNLRGWRVVCAAFFAIAAAAPAAAQRSGENAAKSADDAFGTSVGNERVGLYNPFSARGFSPVQAGNVRIEGLYFDFQADLQERLIAGSTIRIGLSAQGYPFPAPTGIADYALRKPGEEAVLSVGTGWGPFGGKRLDLDGQMPLSGSFGIAGGIGINREELPYGPARNVVTAAVVPRWRPMANLEITPFWGLSEYSGQEPQRLFFTRGNAFLPPRIERRRYNGQPWADSSGRGINYGVLSNLALGEWILRGGMFRSLNQNHRNFTDLALNIEKDGMADHLLIAEKDRRFGSISGELRLSRRLDEGERRHILHVAVRGREQKRRYGGGQTIFLGRARLDERIDFAEPEVTFGPQTSDTVRQFTGGIGYEGRWRGRGELALGLQRSFYRKQVEKPTGPTPVSKDRPWLMNGALSIYATPKLVFYGGYTKGLEESPVAPEIARNKDEAPPAIITEQMDAGLRYAISDRLRLVAGLFDVKKPYYALDETRLYTNLGSLRHRGVELSLAGQVTTGLNIVAGTVFLDATVSGKEVEQGLIGERPLGSYVRYSTLAVDQQLPWVRGLSVDFAYESTSRRTSNRQNTLYIPGRYVFSPGLRYRFNLGGNPSVLRAQIGTLNNVYGYNNVGEGFVYNVPRRYALSFNTDL